MIAVIKGIAGILIGVGLVVSVVAALDWLGVASKPQPSQTEINFRAACNHVNGVTIWNGKNWECLK